MAQKVLTKELASICKDCPYSISAGPVDKENMLYWQAMVFGTEDSPYQGGVFYIDIVFPPEYPFK